VIGPTAREDDALPDDHAPEKPTGGTLRVGETVKLAYVDQSRDVLKDEMSSTTRSPEGRRTWRSAGARSTARFRHSFNFRGADQQKAGHPLGRRRNRVHLPDAQSGSNVLLLDDRPTTWTSTRCARPRTRCWSTPVRGLISTTAGS